MARVTQIETFTQHYDKSLGVSCTEAAFRSLLGDTNWSQVERFWADQLAQGFASDIPGESPIEKLVADIRVEGHAVLSFSLLPTNHRNFVVDGVGRYTVHVGGILVFSGDYTVEQDLHDLSELQSGRPISLAITQTTMLHVAPAEAPAPAESDHANHSEHPGNEGDAPKVHEAQPPAFDSETIDAGNDAGALAYTSEPSVDTHSERVPEVEEDDSADFNESRSFKARFGIRVPYAQHASNKHVYGIDYDTPSQIFIHDICGEQEKVIGTLKFTMPVPADRKIFDLRGLRFMRSYTR